MPLLIVRQDITKMPCDVIVNATNRHMTCDYGVSKAILDAAGEGLNDWVHRFIDVGEVLISPGFDLPCKHIVHIAGPVWRGGEFLEREQLALCYRNVLKAAVSLGASSVAIPLISSGARGFPKDLVLDIAVETIATFLEKSYLDAELEVYLVVYDKNSFSIGKELFGDIVDYISKNYEGDVRDAAYDGVRKYALEPEIQYKRANKSAKGYKSETSAEEKSDTAGEDRSERSAENKSEIAENGKDDGGDTYARRREELSNAIRNAHLQACAAPPRRASEAPPLRRFPTAFKIIKPIVPYGERDIHEILRQADESFAQTLFKLIDARHISDVECYKKANVSRQTWHKILSDDSYRPSKTTVIAFAIALELNLDETKHLLQTVGFALSKSIYFDIIIEFFISQGEYDVYKINSVLYKFDQPLLGV